MLHRLAELAISRPRAILVGALLLLTGSAIYGYDVADHLRSLGATDPAAQSSIAAAALAEQFPASRPNLVLLVTCDNGVDDPAAAAAGSALADRLSAEPSVTGVIPYWHNRSPTLRSTDGRQALITARITGSELAAAARSTELSRAYDGHHGPITVRTGGAAAVADQAQRTITEDLTRAELISLPLTLLVLVAVFGSAVAALLPLAVGAIAMVGTGAVLKLISTVTDLSIFAQELSVALGLGLAIDYALFLVRRFREERAGHGDPATAIRITVRTTGRTVVYSALTVAISLGTLLLFPLGFLRSFAYVGISVVLLAAVSALLVVPAGLLVLGKHVDALDVRRLFRRRKPGEGWRRMATTVMSFAPLFACVTIAVLVVLALPYRDVRFGMIDDRQLPASAPARLVQQEIRDHFSGNAGGRLDVLVSGPAATRQAVADFSLRLSQLPGVVAVTADTADVVVVSSFDAVSTAAQDLVRAIRALPTPFTVQVAGQAAELVDTQHAIGSRLPYALTVIGLTTLVLLFLMTGSVLVPVKTVLVNGLSLTATFGAVVWVFQQGHLSNWLGFTPVGSIDTTLPMLMFCLAFGLSMDYGVLLQSRIQEEYERTGDNQVAVATGLQRSAGVVTAAAAILVIVLVAVGTSGVLNMKMLGLGTALAVAIDATVVRCLLVPSVMALAGRFTWWAPRPLRRIHQRPQTTEMEEGCGCP